jgi:hypothetical protein
MMGCKDKGAQDSTVEMKYLRHPRKGSLMSFEGFLLVPPRIYLLVPPTVFHPPFPLVGSSWMPMKLRETEFEFQLHRQQLLR